MRFLKRVLLAVLIYAAIYLPFIAILQAVSLADYTAAYTVGGAMASVELILCALIKREEAKAEKNKEEKNELGRSDSMDNNNSCAGCGDGSRSDIDGEGVAGKARGDDK